MLLSGVHHTKNKNLKLSNVVEDDEWKSASTANRNQQKNADRDLLPICASRFPRFQGISLPTQPYVGRTSSRQTLHPYEKGDGIEPGTYRLASLIFFQTSS